MLDLTRRARLRFWLFAMDALAALPRGLGYPAWAWALQRAADATDWGEGADCSGDTEHANGDEHV
jgi:hypothetical protein